MYVSLALCKAHENHIEAFFDRAYHVMKQCTPFLFANLKVENASGRSTWSLRGKLYSILGTE